MLLFGVDDSSLTTKGATSAGTGIVVVSELIPSALLNTSLGSSPTVLLLLISARGFATGSLNRCDKFDGAPDAVFGFDDDGNSGGVGVVEVVFVVDDDTAHGAGAVVVVEVVDDAAVDDTGNPNGASEAAVVTLLLGNLGSMIISGNSVRLLNSSNIADLDTF